MFGDHGLCGLLEEGTHEKSPKCLGRNLGDFGEFLGILGNFAKVFSYIKIIISLYSGMWYYSEK